MTDELINSCMMNMRSKIIETIGRMKDLAKNPSTEDTADELSRLAIRLAQIESGINALNQLAPSLAEIANRYPQMMAPLPEPVIEQEPVVIDETMSETLKRVSKIHEDSKKALDEEEPKPKRRRKKKTEKLNE
jgi:hypothetical protein